MQEKNKPNLVVLSIAEETKDLTNEEIGKRIGLSKLEVARRLWSLSEDAIDRNRHQAAVAALGLLAKMMGYLDSGNTAGFEIDNNGKVIEIRGQVSDISKDIALQRTKRVEL